MLCARCTHDLSCTQKHYLFKHMFNRATRPPRPSCENLAEFAWWKIFCIIFRKPIKLTSAVGVRLMGQYKHTNINLTTGMRSD